MPLIRIENHPDLSQNQLCRLARALQDACLKAKVPGIEWGQVTVVAGGTKLLFDDSTLLIIVEGLFDRPDRTKEVRDRLADMLAQAARTKMHNGRIEVLVNRFNPEVDSYVVLERENDNRG